MRGRVVTGACCHNGPVEETTTPRRSEIVKRYGKMRNTNSTKSMEVNLINFQGYDKKQVFDRVFKIVRFGVIFGKRGGKY